VERDISVPSMVGLPVRLKYLTSSASAPIPIHHPQPQKTEEKMEKRLTNDS
jgi:hypothetical protein